MGMDAARIELQDKVRHFADVPLEAKNIMPCLACAAGLFMTARAWAHDSFVQPSSAKKESLRLGDSEDGLIRQDIVHVWHGRLPRAEGAPLHFGAILVKQIRPIGEFSIQDCIPFYLAA